MLLSHKKFNIQIYSLSMLWWCSEGQSQCLPLGIEDKPRPGHSAVILLFLEEGGGRRSGGLFHDYDDDDNDDDAEDADMEKKIYLHAQG